MPLKRIDTAYNEGFYFVTPTVWNWYYLFDRHERWEILADSLSYCQQNKGLLIYAYVFMLNHLHMIVQSPDVSGFLRDFKRYTTTQLRKNIETYEPNVMELFSDRNKGYCIWKEDNQPKLIENEAFFLQKLSYIHNNPVIKGYVMQPEHWKWSSANPYSPIKVENYL